MRSAVAIALVSELAHATVAALRLVTFVARISRFGRPVELIAVVVSLRFTVADDWCDGTGLS